MVSTVVLGRLLLPTQSSPAPAAATAEVRLQLRVTPLFGVIKGAVAGSSVETAFHRGELPIGTGGIAARRRWSCCPGLLGVFETELVCWASA